ncbi:carotenoid oxygenase [Phyllosticta citriasiana]|uniref:carotenoid oxygenase n=1 Tax=Phyllosticta citriasiana TaxID=595635 RepID=UPI0030FD9160
MRPLKRRDDKHPYLSGNYAPIIQTRPLTPCTYTGTIPRELAGGQYVRNGANPVSNEDLGRDAHWFDGDGMLSGVLFKRGSTGEIEPEYVAQYILTDLFLATITNPSLRHPILPSIATLVNPASSLMRIISRIMRTIFLVILSFLPGSRQVIKKISVANTAIYYHDGRALATCESGPPIRIALPNLETVGWFNGNEAEGESLEQWETEKKEAGFGGAGLLGFMKEWTTGHPKVDPTTNEMLLYHCTFAPPYVHYSIIPASQSAEPRGQSAPKLLNQPVRGVSGGKMMHDFGVSKKHTVILDLPLTLDPLNLLKNRPTLSYDPSAPSRFGVFPRRSPSQVQWFETSACCIFHTANAWDSEDKNGNVSAVNLLACRLTSATVVYTAGNLGNPTLADYSVVQKKPISFFDSYEYDQTNKPTTTRISRGSAFDAASDLESKPEDSVPLIETAYTVSPLDEEEQCRLYYYRFPLTAPGKPTISHQFALSAIPLEFPAVNPFFSMSAARYVYGCSTSTSSFGAALGKAAKIDVLAKLDVHTLLRHAEANPPAPITGCVDTRPIAAILAAQEAGSAKQDDPIRCFRMPAGWFAQEARFVPRADPRSEDDGFLLFYAFDESQLDADGEAPPSAVSELWVLDATRMCDVVARVRLPQRVPYGLHGEWFTEEMIRMQRAVDQVRTIGEREDFEGAWGRVRKLAYKALA